jgi:hypothetical protein
MSSYTTITTLQSKPSFYRTPTVRTQQEFSGGTSERSRLTARRLRNRRAGPNRSVASRSSALGVDNAENLFGGQDKL